MRNVLVVCGAGASSTFLAHRIRAAARGRGVELVVAASSLEGVEHRLPDVDVLLVGPHLSSRFDELSRLAQAAGARSLLLPSTVFGAQGDDAVLDLMREIDEDQTDRQTIRSEIKEK
jgi:PTS system cellobiose-specific IIB component